MSSKVPPKVITFKMLQEYEDECAKRDAQIEEAQRLIDCLINSNSYQLVSTRINLPHPHEVQLSGWFAPEQLRALADHMEKMGKNM